MEKEFIPYEQALTLKELGFDEPCFSSYDKSGNLVRAIRQEIEEQGDAESSDVVFQCLTMGEVVFG